MHRLVLLPLFLIVASCAPTERAATAPDPASPAVAATEAADEQVRNLIILIGDGVGTAYWTAARFKTGRLHVERMPVAGLTDTRSSDSYVTDSAAGATVYATGQRTYNGAIGVGDRCAEMFAADSAAVMQDPASCDPLEGIFDIAYRAGIATGLVASSSITHATPAAFGAKVPYRRHQAEIAEQMAENPIDVLLGGGRGFFDGTLRDDGRDLWTPLCREAVCLTTPTEFDAYQVDDRRLVGLFAENHMEAADERRPTLLEMTRVALERLERNPAGFFVMIEGSQPDWRGHANDPLPDVVSEMVDFDETVGVALDFAERTPGTLVLVVADHETGGLALQMEADTLTAAYTTGGHTASMTPHFAWGPGAERFSGIRDNDEIGRMLIDIARRRARVAR